MKTDKRSNTKEALETVVFAILIHEDFNRPKVARAIENTKQRLAKKLNTLGVMQDTSDKIISDLESVKPVTAKFVNAYCLSPKKIGLNFKES